MVRVISLFLILFVGMFFSKSAYSLTVYEVIERIVNNSPELRVIFEKKNQVVAGYKDQRSQYLPQIYTIFNREYNKNDPITSSADSAWEAYNKLQLIIEQRLFDVEQMTRILSSAQAVQTQEFENQKLLESLIQLAVISYYDVIQSEYLVSINREYLRQVREIETLTTNMRNQGDATLGDVNLVQSRLASANSNLILA
ncbi:MAG: TolC family protein, partial [Alphaproteobacteria bacterium]|nr:TolC family protein [Alphaproteobacteria bacterium]